MNPVSLLDYHIYKDAFSTVEMRSIFNEQSAIRTWVEVEIAVTEALADAGVVPRDAADVIRDTLNSDAIDLEQLKLDSASVGRPIVGLVRQLTEQVDAPHNQWVHYGFTTYDVMDTATVLQMRSGVTEIQRCLDTLRSRWETLAETHRNTLMIGRTNGQHAQPTTFGARVATWLEELMRHQKHLGVQQDDMQFQLGSMVGSLASFGDRGLVAREALADKHNLKAPLTNWHNARDSHARILQTLSLLCASLARIARDIASLESTDIGELIESGETGRGRSSGMPHKRNPRSAEYAEAVATLGRQRAAGSVEIMGQEHERSGGTYIAEWVTIPEVFLLTSGAIHWMNDLTRRLTVDDKRMALNMDKTRGMALSERYVLELAKHVGKQTARSLVDEACNSCYLNECTLVEALCSNARVTSALTDNELHALNDPSGYVGTAGEMIDNVLTASRAIRYQVDYHTLNNQRLRDEC